MVGKPKRKKTGPGERKETKRAAKTRIRTSRATGQATPTQIERALEQAGAAPAPDQGLEQGLDAHAELDGTGDNVPCAGEEPQ